MHPASPEDGERFFAERFPAAAAIADPGHALYESFGLVRGSLTQVAGPAVWLPTLRSLFSGHGGSRPKGDPMVLAGQFVARDGQLIYVQRTTHAAEEGRWDEMIALAKSS